MSDRVARLQQIVKDLADAMPVPVAMPTTPQLPRPPNNLNKPVLFRENADSAANSDVPQWADSPALNISLSAVSGCCTIGGRYAAHFGILVSFFFNLQWRSALFEVGPTQVFGQPALPIGTRWLNVIVTKREGDALSEGVLRKSLVPSFQVHNSTVITIRTIVNCIVGRGGHLFHESPGGCGCRSWSCQVLTMLIRAGIAIPRNPTIAPHHYLDHLQHSQAAYEAAVANQPRVTIADETGAHFAFQARESFNHWNAYQHYSHRRAALEKAQSALVEEQTRRG